jgi:hypothetical protein
MPGLGQRGELMSGLRAKLPLPNFEGMPYFDPMEIRSGVLGLGLAPCNVEVGGELS